MKQFKLIKFMLMSGIVATTMPIVSISCASKFNFELDTETVHLGTDEILTVKLRSNSGEKINVEKINNVKAKDSKVLEVKWCRITDGIATIGVIGNKNSTTDLTIDIADSEEQSRIKIFSIVVEPYQIADLIWDKPHLRPNEMITSSEFKLEADGKESSQKAEWRILEGTDSCLNVTLLDDYVTIIPTDNAIGKINKIVVGGYINNILSATRTFVVKDVAYKSMMTYDGIEYTLADNINPNVFVTWSTHGWTINTIWLEDGTYIEIGGSQEEWDKLTSLTIASCDPKVTRINQGFLNGCSNLAYLDLSNMPSIEIIETNFVVTCNGLTDIDISGLSNVKEIQGAFLAWSGSFPYIDLTPLSNVTIIGNNFLTQCYALESVDLLPFKNVTSIGGNFLLFDRKIKTLDFSSLSKVTSVGICFVYGLDDLTTADIRPLKSIRTIDGMALAQCKNLVSVNASGLSYLTTIGGDFASYNDKLKSLDASRLRRLKSIGNYFAFSDWVLEDVDVSEMYSLQTIGSYAFTYSYPLKSIDLSGWINIRRVGNLFLADCTSLTSISFKKWNNIQRIGNCFLIRCNSLRTLDLSSFTSVSYIDGNFLYEYKDIEEIIMPNRDPRLITLVENGSFWYLNPNAVLHCGYRLDEYKTTYPWSLRAKNMQF